jgi:predicted  nucleic acid-binding Zn-ribbon protein
MTDEVSPAISRLESDLLDSLTKIKRLELENKALNQRLERYESALWSVSVSVSMLGQLKDTDSVWYKVLQTLNSNVVDAEEVQA